MYSIYVPHQQIVDIKDVIKLRKFNYKTVKKAEGTDFVFKEEVQRDFAENILNVMIGVSNKRKKLTRGTMVQGTDKTYERSIYEVLADNGEVLLLLARKYGGNIINNYGTLNIRRKDRFEVVPAIDCLDIPPNKMTSLGLPDNWVKDYHQISFSYGDKTFRKCVFIDLVEAFDGGDRYLDFKMKWEKELSNLNRISNILNSK